MTAQPPRQRIALAGGYTAGHVMPMLAVAEHWPLDLGAGLPLMLGAKGGIEQDLAREAGLDFAATPIAPLHGRQGVLSRSSAYLQAANGARLARRILKAQGVGLVLGFGGYVSAPYLVAARTLGVPFAVFEANAVPGLTNRRLVDHAALALTAWPATTTYPGWSKAITVGLPLRRDIVHALAASHVRRADQAVHLLVTGGTLGSEFLNRAVPELLVQLRRKGFALDVLHQCGAGQCSLTQERYRQAAADARLMEFIDDMAGAWRWADLVICSAGAGTLAEAQAFDRPGLVVPNTRVADDHQTHNARSLLAGTRLLPLFERDWCPETAAECIVELIEQSATGIARQPPSTASVASARIVQLLHRQLEAFKSD